MEPNSICNLRIAVAHLGEKSNPRWWDTAFLDGVGFRFLGLVYPKTSVSASVISASEAAARVHDERIGKGRVAHLFRLSPEIEAKIQGELSKLGIEKLQKICEKETALQFLDAIAKRAKPISGTGPIQIGELSESNSTTGLASMAATYAAGFRSDTRVFPYFA